MTSKPHYEELNAILEEDNLRQEVSVQLKQKNQ
jgi:hypothetical protein